MSSTSRRLLAVLLGSKSTSPRFTDSITCEEDMDDQISDSCTDGETYESSDDDDGYDDLANFDGGEGDQGKRQVSPHKLLQRLEKGEGHSESDDDDDDENDPNYEDIADEQDNESSGSDKNNDYDEEDYRSPRIRHSRRSRHMRHREY